MMFMKEKLKKVPKALLLCIWLRILSVFIVQTSFVPDEYWQSLEIAHKMVFGYGYTTWEWRLGIRSYIYPAFIACIYKILDMMKCDSVEAIIMLPRLMQSLLSAIGDYYFVKWHQKTTGSNGNWAWFTVITCWFWFYCASRTLTNTLETNLAMVGLYLYPWNQVLHKQQPKKKPKTDKTSQISYLWFASLACFVRPTAAIFWAPLVVFQTMTATHKSYLVMSKHFPIAITLLLVSTQIDTYFHGKWVVTWWNFFDINVTKGIGEFYGVHSSFWYFSTGLPTILGMLVLPFSLGILRICKTGYTLNVDLVMTFTGVWTLFVLSCLPHKEFRFLLPLTPWFFHVSASWLSIWSRRANGYQRYGFATLIAASSIALTVYLGLFHQRGTLDAINILAKESRQDPLHTNLLFLMPCHSTPLYSHLHVNVSARFLTCEPDLLESKTKKKSKSNAYLDEAEVFYADPGGWLNGTFPSNGTYQLPSHIIFFDSLHLDVESFLKANCYHYLAHAFHTGFPQDRIGESVFIYKNSGKCS